MNERLSGDKTILEPAREVNVFRETEVLVVGGGPGGSAAAVAAAREGANTILVERYGHLGGMATGGLVLMINQPPPGQCQEWIDRLDKVGGARNISIMPGPSRRNYMVNPELLKCVINDMANETGVNLLLHSWGTQAIVDKNSVQGIIFESKSGRQAILAKVTIDATGDGDIFASAGAEFDGTIDRNLRSSQLAVVFRIGNVDFDKFADFRQSNPQKWQEMRDEVDSVAGFHLGPVPGSRSDVVWVNNFIKGLDPLEVKDLTWVEVNVRKAMLPVYEYLKKHVPGFENGFIYDSASQIGTRGSRRLIGEYVLTKQDIESGATHDDTIAIFLHGAGQPAAIAPQGVELPYRCLVPVSMEGLLVAGRCFSSDPVANDRFNIIACCIAMGQAAGTAAALAVKNKVNLRKVDTRILQEHLSAQGVSLPVTRSTQLKA